MPVGPYDFSFLAASSREPSTMGRISPLRAPTTTSTVTGLPMKEKMKEENRMKPMIRYR